MQTQLYMGRHMHTDAYARQTERHTNRCREMHTQTDKYRHTYMDIDIQSRSLRQRQIQIHADTQEKHICTDLHIQEQTVPLLFLSHACAHTHRQINDLLITYV
jgi:FixJ family two-component response regulator